MNGQVVVDEMLEIMGSTPIKKVDEFVPFNFNEDDFVLDNIIIAQGNELTKIYPKGSIVDMGNGQILSLSEDNPIEIIMIACKKIWVEKNQKTSEVLIYNATSPNEKKLEEILPNGHLIKRRFYYEFTGILPEQIKDNIEFPVKIKIGGGSVFTGKKIMTELSKNSEIHKKYSNIVFRLSSKEKPGLEGTWFSWVKLISRKASTQEEERAEYWTSRQLR